jgi:hypothetical protein
LGVLWVLEHSPSVRQAETKTPAISDVGFSIRKDDVVAFETHPPDVERFPRNRESATPGLEFEPVGSDAQRTNHPQMSHRGHCDYERGHETHRDD